MKPSRILPLLLAAGLQVMPMLRAVLPLATRGLAPSTWAIILKFAAGPVALLGSYHAVSGATNIVAPYTVKATVGVRYTRQLGTSGQTAHSWSAATAPLKTAVYPLTPGLFLTNATGKIGGIPTWAGTSNIVIKAWENTGNSGASVSATFVFTITNASGGTPPAITQQPQSRTVIAGQSTNFTVSATGTAPLSYFWRKGTAVVQTGTNVTYVLNNVQAGAAGTYSVIVSNAAGTVTSTNATLTVVTPVTISAQPTNRIVTSGVNIAFGVTATGTSPKYQWRFNSNAIAGATSATLNLTNVTPANSGFYSVVVTNTANRVTSSEARLLVTPPPSGGVAPTLPPARLAGGQLQFSLRTTAGYRHVVQYNDTLSATNWITLTNIPADFVGTTLSLPQPINTSPKRFYRVMLMGN
jgi:hypothetical protein